jgi:hypothetical protein
VEEEIKGGLIEVEKCGFQIQGWMVVQDGECIIPMDRIIMCIPVGVAELTNSSSNLLHKKL